MSETYEGSPLISPFLNHVDRIESLLADLLASVVPLSDQNEGRLEGAFDHHLNQARKARHDGGRWRLDLRVHLEAAMKNLEARVGPLAGSPGNLALLDLLRAYVAVLDMHDRGEGGGAAFAPPNTGPSQSFKVLEDLPEDTSSIDSFVGPVPPDDLPRPVLLRDYYRPGKYCTATRQAVTRAVWKALLDAGWRPHYWELPVCDRPVLWCVPPVDFPAHGYVELSSPPVVVEYKLTHTPGRWVAPGPRPPVCCTYRTVQR